MNEVLFALLNPFFSIITIGLVVFYLLPKKRKTTCLISVILLVVFSIPYPIYKLVQKREFINLPLERDALNTEEHYHIMVMGAGKNNDLLLAENLRLSQEVLSRLVEGVKWCKRLPKFTLICSGPWFTGNKSQALLLKETAIMLGVPSQNIQLIDKGYNTKTEALQYVQSFGKDTPFILCTSALHMNRSKAWFQYYGVSNIYPAPAHYLAPNGRITWKKFLPSLSSYGLWQSYLKELLGEFVI